MYRMSTIDRHRYGSELTTNIFSSYSMKSIASIYFQGIQLNDRTWHRTCFHCSKCQCSLIDRVFSIRQDRLICRMCLNDEFGQRCYRCNRTFQSGNDTIVTTQHEQYHRTIDIWCISQDESCIKYAEQFYHRTCLICHACQQPFINEPIHRRHHYLLCSACYMRLAAIYCIKCYRVSTTICRRIVRTTMWTNRQELILYVYVCLGYS
jgi:hypothetical protein